MPIVSADGQFRPLHPLHAVLLVEWHRCGWSRSGRPTAHFLALLVMWVLGLINALGHAKDAWATMPASVYLSIAVALLALAASWIWRITPNPTSPVRE